MQTNHFIENIEIKNYKCFKNLKVNKIKRVNLIGGKNNIGKTAFMEVCCINVYSKTIAHFREILIHPKISREKINLLFNETIIDDNKILESYNNIFTKSNINTVSFGCKDNGIENIYTFTIQDKEMSVNANLLSRNKKAMHNIRFIDNFGLSNREIIINYEAIQRKKEELFLNDILNQFDNRIESFKILGDKPTCEINEKYYEITEFGDGLKHLITVVTALFKCENGYLFIDEIDNGIHYTKLEEIWKIIFEISKKLNVQVFATTHSKECIEVFNEVNQTDEGSYFEFYRNQKTGLIVSKQRDYKQLEYSLTHNGRMRGE